MQWRIELEVIAERSINKLDKPSREHIRAFLKDILMQDNPRIKGKALQGNLKGLWRYRVGDYRIICRIKDSELIILVVELGHRVQTNRA